MSQSFEDFFVSEDFTLEEDVSFFEDFDDLSSEDFGLSAAAAFLYDSLR